MWQLLHKRVHASIIVELPRRSQEGDALVVGMRNRTITEKVIT